MCILGLFLVTGLVVSKKFPIVSLQKLYKLPNLYTFNKTLSLNQKSFSTRLLTFFEDAILRGEPGDFNATS